MNIDLENLEEFKFVIGCDEVGRGPIAGPVNAAAVMIESHKNNKKTLEKFAEINITDSKKLSAKKRKQILSLLNIDFKTLELDRVYKIDGFDGKISFSLSELDHTEIDRINILQASLLSMKTCIKSLSAKKTKNEFKALIDGNKLVDLDCHQEAVIKGDSKVLSIALASIIAKEFRDEKMLQFDKQYPGYKLAKNAGYPTKEHKDAVKEIGPSPIHRKTFRGVKEYLS